MRSTWRLHAGALLIRVALLAYGVWQDSKLDLKFTDVDYHVFTDAAEYVLMGKSPYDRPTYRYSPLLAWLLIPCHKLHIAWGKILFILADLATGLLIQASMHRLGHKTQQIKLGVCLWLFNPITVTVSSRGNAESIMSALVIGTIYALFTKHTTLSGVLFGISVHLKIYPLVTTLSIFLLLGSEYCFCGNEIKFNDAGKFKNLLKKILSKERLQFFVAALFTLSFFTAGFYALYGLQFLEHTYLYHLIRKDIRHNFSQYFYMLYTNPDQWLGLVCFFFQLITITCVSCCFYKDLPFCSFLLTFSFVTFNKICTSQYFLWYLTYMPLLVPGMARVKKLEITCAVGLWATSQSIWLGCAYQLEFRGKNVFLYVWMSSLIFFAVNVLIMVWFIKRYASTTTFFNGVLQHESAINDKKKLE